MIILGWMMPKHDYCCSHIYDNSARNKIFGIGDNTINQLSLVRHKISLKRWTHFIQLNSSKWTIINTGKLHWVRFATSPHTSCDSSINNIHISYNELILIEWLWDNTNVAYVTIRLELYPFKFSTHPVNPSWPQ